MLTLLFTLARTHDHAAEVREVLDEQTLTCGSVVRLKHATSGFHLHSHDISYGSGSAQQSVTTIKSDGDPGSLWIFKEAEGEAPCRSGAPLLCGSTVRLEHMGTHKNLHSHEFQSPLSGNNEVSCYGDKGYGDHFDNWVLECKGNTEKVVGAA
jgi:dolichyl-phosphate-mannose--protein O-mannosyl transferase